MKTRILLGVSIFALVATVIFAAELRDIDKQYHETFEVREGAALHLDHGDGDVTITPWEKDVVEVSVEYHAQVKGGQSSFTVEFGQDGDTLSVVGHESGSPFKSIRRREYTYEIRAPRYVHLDLEGDDGDVSIEGWRGRIKCSNDDGDVSIADCSIPEGKIRLEDGDFTAIGCEGNFTVELDDGDVRFDELRASKLRINTEDGDIDLGLLATDDLDASVSTDDGDVKVEVEPGFSASFEIKTDDGRILIDVADANTLQKSENRVSGRINDGSGQLEIHTSDGHVTLRQSG